MTTEKRPFRCRFGLHSWYADSGMIRQVRRCNHCPAVEDPAAAAARAADRARIAALPPSPSFAAMWQAARGGEGPDPLVTGLTSTGPAPDVNSPVLTELAARCADQPHALDGVDWTQVLPTVLDVLAVELRDRFTALDTDALGDHTGDPDGEPRYATGTGAARMVINGLLADWPYD